MEYDLSKCPVQRPSWPTIVEGMEVSAKRLREIRPEDGTKIEHAIKRMDIKPTFDLEEAKKRVSHGFYFITLQLEDKIIGWDWAGVDKVYFDQFNCHIQLRKGHVFSFNTYIEKAYRGRGLNSIVVKGKLYELVKDGYGKIWGLAHKWNQASIKSFENMNWKFLGNYNFIKLFFLNLRFPPKGI